LLYAEPGDSIYFQTNLVAQEFQKKFYLRNDSSEIEIKKYIVPEKILFSGDRKQEAEILNKFQELSGLLPFQIRRNFLYVDNGRSDAEIYLDAIPKIDQILEKSDLNLRSESAIYLQHEMQAFLYSNLYTSRQSESEDNWIMELGTIIANDILKKTIYSQLDTFNIHRIYNDYGIFSRSLTSKYVNYKYSRLNPINNNSFSGFDFRYGRLNEPEQLIQLAKMVLNGSPLYREIADQYYFYSLKPFNEIINKSKWWPEAEETFSLILEKCNDEVFIRDLEAIQSTSLKWENMRYIPDVKLLNLQKQETTLQSFIAKKATIFYTAYDWSAARYEMDELAPQFPEINFVLINQGSNYDLWKEWNDRAEPKAIQLFLLTDSIQLEDLFQDKLNNYLIYNQSGERIGNEHELTRAVQIAKGMVKAPKKELNKSTLQGIIIFLVGSMLLVLILFLAYKYRMKQRLKNQAQEKRLRELQMAAIRAQMNPHFLFNSLNSVQNLIQQNKAREAHLYLSDFAGLIRKVLRNSDKEEVPLAEELEMMEQYLNLEKLRFDFDYTIEVDKGIDQSLFMVPSMILQPVAENALLHGLQHKTGEKKIMIRISKTENGILISIEDNGIGLEEAKKLKTKSNGVGLRMNEERIQMMKEKYGGNYSIKMIDLTEQGREGTLIEIFIPDEQ
jgi:two-component sensor histidine kinase